MNYNSETIEAYSRNPTENICTSNGNMVSSPLGSFSFDSFNRLAAVKTTFYTYDVEGTRIKTQKGENPPLPTPTTLTQDFRSC